VPVTSSYRLASLSRKRNSRFWAERTSCRLHSPEPGVFAKGTLILDLSSIGILNIECDKENAFNRFGEETVTGLAGLATIAIQNSRECSVLSPALRA
jgi:hypothetical protein